MAEIMRRAHGKVGSKDTIYVKSNNGTKILPSQLEPYLTTANAKSGKLYAKMLEWGLIDDSPETRAATKGLCKFIDTQVKDTTIKNTATQKDMSDKDPGNNPRLQHVLDIIGKVMRGERSMIGVIYILSGFILFYAHVIQTQRADW